MDDILKSSLPIIIGGVVLALLTFVAAVLWNFRAAWIADQIWAKEAQKSLESHSEKLERVLLAITGIDGRLTHLEHPPYPGRSVPKKRYVEGID